MRLAGHLTACNAMATPKRPILWKTQLWSGHLGHLTEGQPERWTVIRANHLVCLVIVRARFQESRAMSRTTNGLTVKVAQLEGAGYFALINLNHVCLCASRAMGTIQAPCVNHMCLPKKRAMAARTEAPCKGVHFQVESCAGGKSPCPTPHRNFR